MQVFGAAPGVRARLRPRPWPSLRDRKRARALQEHKSELEEKRARIEAALQRWAAEEKAKQGAQERDRYNRSLKGRIANIWRRFTGRAGRA